MRLWTLSPVYLDTKGLLAAWREGLLALAVLSGKTKGYRNHPQLIRFRQAADPVGYLVRYLEALADEADARGYRFDRARITANRSGDDLTTKESSIPQVQKSGENETLAIPATEGQIAYEAALLFHKLTERKSTHGGVQVRDALERSLRTGLALNPAFRAVPGEIADWERTIPEILEMIR